MSRFAAAPSGSRVTAMRVATAQRPGPQAALVNQVATAGGVEITLLSYVVVDHALRLYGALRVMSHHEPVLASVPVLELTRVRSAAPLRPLGAHVLPERPTVWLSWMFEFADPEPGVLAARIEHLELGFRTGKWTENVVGPWVFDDIRGPGQADVPARRLAVVVP